MAVKCRELPVMGSSLGGLDFVELPYCISSADTMGESLHGSAMEAASVGGGLDLLASDPNCHGVHVR